MLDHEVEYDSGVVIRVAIYLGKYTHRLQGMDRYWIYENQYGMYNVDDGYEGKQAVSFEYDGDKVHDTGGILPPEGAEIWHGEWVPDERARQLGLL